MNEKYKDSNITFVIFTYNEEKRIKRVVENFIQYGKVLIADNKSTDKTVSIAKSIGCDVYTRPEHCVFVENQVMMNNLASVVETDWIYWGFADEMLEVETIAKVFDVINSDQYDIINILRKNYFQGKFCYDSFSARTNKIFKVGSIDFTDNKIHGFGSPTVEKKRIFTLADDKFVHHFISNDINSYLNTINRYTDLELMESNHRCFFVDFFIRPLSLFIRNFILKKGFKAGFEGFSLCVLHVMYIVITRLKSYEKLHGLTTAKIEEVNNIKRDSILGDISK